MVEIFKDLIRHFHASPLPELSRRALKLPDFPQGTRKVLAFIGMRRSGKTYTLYQIMQDLLAEDIPFSKILYINFEDERLDIRKEYLQDIIKAYYELYPEYIGRSDIHFFFDEIHEIEGWEKFIRRLLDQEKAQLYITGSSSKLLSKEIASSLRGRTYSFEIFPFNFPESLKKMNLEVPLPQYVTGKSRIEIKKHLQDFLKWGGFPEVIGADPELHYSILQEYANTVLYRDIVDRYGIHKIQTLRQLMFHCLRHSATQFSVNKMYQTFRSMGYETGRDSLYEYMDYFEDAYCVFSLEKFDLSQRKSTTASKKIYAVDQGLITAVTMASHFDLGAQLETALFAFLRRFSENLFYYKTKDDKEVDFVILLRDHTYHLFQVTLSLKDEKTQRREVDALEKAMTELNVSHGTIVTLDEEGELIRPNGKIKIVPIWRLFLENRLV